MHSIGLDDVGSALLITLIMLIVSLTVVGLAMWWLYRIFKNKDDKTAQTDQNTGSKGQTSDH
jgi:heme/copper-type cytochrome/quinol oxidase subunit 2